jgi:hypothetical protein
MALERQRLRRHDAQQAMAHHERQVSNFDRPPSRTYGFVQRRGTRGLTSSVGGVATDPGSAAERCTNWPSKR